ncbi:MAG: flagellar biosynthetic protein FliO [Bacteroides sp.]|nr:flagellar biosynthetic protein FliO [Eubacterium sp.]MCM1418399.1 flagellar biosynthetic protein FliO [Roseburia sp.]MCM1461579.1 flagellar biosynthetic protein FliO [Bacteroides sp.]
MGEILWVVLCLALVFGLLFLFLYVMKRLSNGVGVVNGSKMRVLDRVTVGRDGMLLVVSVCDRLILIAVTPQRIEKLCDLETSPEEYAAGLQRETAQGGFSSALAAAMKRREEKKSEKGDGE